MATTGYSITYHAHQGSFFLGDIPHAFVTINVPGQQSVKIGYCPVSTAVEAPGAVKNDALSGLDGDKRPIPHRETYSRTSDVSPGQAEAMLACTANKANAPGRQPCAAQGGCGWMK